MSLHQESAFSPLRAQSENEHEDTSSHSSHETIDSQPTSPSHSATTEEDLAKSPHSLHDPSSSSNQGETETDPDIIKANSEAHTKTEKETEQELFKDPEPIKANSAEIQEFSRLAEELSLFASCIVASPPPPAPSSPNISISTSPFLSSPNPKSKLDPYTDADKTPTQASSSSSATAFQESAEASAAEAALISQRRAELQADLMELIQAEADGRNRELILGIERLMRDWKGLHEGLERWRGERKGERVREMYKREMEG
ncbi:hypothetical protein BKA64DRAFT_657118 [Cadophora sp. MPI-SDFR-AT-0126]|nr:hypothetical protein BKA64DRAFT_657118 [Leotiomycetes sp. MPI-SDFR-AT-0126]